MATTPSSGKVVALIVTNGIPWLKLDGIQLDLMNQKVGLVTQLQSHRNCLKYKIEPNPESILALKRLTESSEGDWSKVL